MKPADEQLEQRHPPLPLRKKPLCFRLFSFDDYTIQAICVLHLSNF